jgi:hypothetical protein
MTYEVVSCVWDVTSTWTVTARSLGEARMRASEELRERSYGAYLVSVRPMPQPVADGGDPFPADTDKTSQRYLTLSASAAPP